ncbi:MAG: EAL domain-containing protein [Sterolibacteriaceae bacterium]|uniref:EAL domain-containing protein n=1 Tax=Candidatus Methylophosphatis roskildensis TaxID=2899263 RepID=A0A9D7E1Q1_9PROT|nr:EAL domain-containing protein [Candidatus Methylophosphatis roskildensis]
MNQDIRVLTQELPPGYLTLVEMRSPLLDAKVMMVDDDTLMTDLIRTHLEDAGYSNFIVTNSPREALDLVRQEKPGVLLLDLMMPEVSGFTILEAIRAEADLRFIPVIVLTASSGSDFKLRALRLGATDFLAKPVDPSELVLRVRNTLAFEQYHDWMSHFDYVTGLPNERRFEGIVGDLLARQVSRGGLLAMISITVPECRQLRETIDRPTADGLAVVVARRLERIAGTYSAVDQRHRVARFSEQHFGLVIDGLKNIDAVETTAKAVLAALAEPVMLGQHEVAPAPWLGIAVAPGDGQLASTLRQSADLAGTHGRQQGTAHASFASPELNAKSYQRLRLGAQLRGVTQRGELRLHYQPKVHVSSQRIVGLEALVCWQHPDRGLVPPMEFIPLAEELGLIAGIGQWVFEQACRDMAVWMQAGLENLTVAVNVSKPQVVSGDLGQVVRQVLRDSGLPAHRLVLELTESMVMDDVPQCVSMMHELKALGVRLSIDDFGTGYSSLAYLKKFPLDELKIDRSFIIDLPGGQADKALVRTVIDLGHSLGMSVIAEGVETNGQLECLNLLGCDSFQGYLFSRPLPLDQCTEMLSRAETINHIA